MPFFKKKPIVIEAFQPSTMPLPQWATDAVNKSELTFPADGSFEVWTLEGRMTGTPDSYIVKGVKGELYPCRADIFEETYEATE